ncbi:MAG: EamA family transporter [Candidatus Eisenbacteria bacterium]|nr:EamA family transporter [Candidatus Eisenbacteria bacterium]
MPAHLIGELAALGAAVLWTTCSILFASAGRRIGALSVNAFRIVIAVILLGAAHLLIQGALWPAANRAQWLYLSLSGLVGLALGDFCYFRSLVLIGPRRGVLMMSLAPVFAAVAAYLVLGEILRPWAIVGVIVTLAGIVIVILESEGASGEAIVARQHKLAGVLLGLGGAAGQGIGLVISKYGMINAASDPTAPLDPLGATLIRMLASAAALWIGIAFSGRGRRIVRSYRDLGAVLRTSGGAFTGPFLGVWLSMVAVRYTVAGVAQTLMTLMPVLVIPYVRIVYGQRTSHRGIFGACVAVVGVAVLLLF